MAVKPSKVTVERRTRTNATIEGDTSAVLRSPAPKGRRFHSRRAGAARSKHAPQSRHAPSRVAQATSHRRQASRSVTRISVGANRARTPKAVANGSAWRSHVARPKKAMPAHVSAE